MPSARSVSLITTLVAAPARGAVSYLAWQRGCDTAVPITAFVQQRGRILAVAADGTTIEPADITGLLPTP